MENVREKLAENIHELWAMGKMDQGWSFSEVTNQDAALFELANRDEALFELSN